MLTAEATKRLQAKPRYSKQSPTLAMLHADLSSEGEINFQQNWIDCLLVTVLYSVIVSIRLCRKGKRMTFDWQAQVSDTAALDSLPFIFHRVFRAPKSALSAERCQLEHMVVRGADKAFLTIDTSPKWQLTFDLPQWTEVYMCFYSSFSLLDCH